MFEIKVKHLSELFSGNDISIMGLMGIKNNLYNRLRYQKELRILSYDIHNILNKNAEDIKYDKDCGIKIPSNIDNISFENMMSLLSFKKEGKDLIEVICAKIALACHEENNVSENTMKRRVLELPFVSAMGIINWINESIRKSQEDWEKRFLSVYVVDKDYDAAGGHAMNQFNVINTIKNTCNDFNVTYKEAWKMPYSVVQTNSYAKATASYVQHKMEQIKKQKMEQQRKRQK